MIDVPPPLSLVAQRVLDFLASLAAAAAVARSPCFLRSAEEKEEEKEREKMTYESSLATHSATATFGISGRGKKKVHIMQLMRCY